MEILTKICSNCLKPAPLRAFCSDLRKSDGKTYTCKDCNNCGEAEFRFLTLDHVNNDGAKHREELRRETSSRGRTSGRSRDILVWARDNNYPKSLQLLCYNCNCGKARNPAKECPHKTNATICITLKPNFLRVRNLLA